jgi:hypothetical protein
MAGRRPAQLGQARQVKAMLCLAVRGKDFMSDGLKFLDAVEERWPGSTRIRRTILAHDEWLKRKRTNGKTWFDLIGENLDAVHDNNDAK